MKNLFIGLLMLAGTSMSFANDAIETKTEINSESAVTKCYRKAVDDFGNTYYVQVPCPKTIILSAAE